MNNKNTSSQPRFIGRSPSADEAGDLLVLSRAFKLTDCFATLAMTGNCNCIIADFGRRHIERETLILDLIDLTIQGSQQLDWLSCG
jgi:hypothetical protein